MDEKEKGTFWTIKSMAVVFGVIGLGLAAYDGCYQDGLFAYLFYAAMYWLGLFIISYIITAIVESVGNKKKQIVVIIIILFVGYIFSVAEIDRPKRYGEEADQKQLELVEWAFEYGYETGWDGYGESAREAYIDMIGDVEDPEEFYIIKADQEQAAKEAKERAEKEAEEAETSDMMDDIVQEPDPTEYTSEGTPINDGFKKDAVPMQKTDRSSCFSEIGYDEREGLLVVTFRSSGESYLYYAVPEDVWEALASADSIGHYYNEEIKGEYTCEKLK